MFEMRVDNQLLVVAVKSRVLYFLFIIFENLITF